MYFSGAKVTKHLQGFHLEGEAGAQRLMRVTIN